MGGEAESGLDVAAVLRKPAVVAAIGAVFGLAMGVIIGRTTVSPPERAPAAARQPDTSKSEAALNPVADDEESEPQRSNEYRVQLGRRVPSGKGGQGFERHRVGTRAVARLVEKQGSIRFDVDPTAGDYLLTAVVHFAGAKSGKLETKLDGQALGSWTLEPGWQMYSARVSHERL
ncbi:MAG TPA: hypothetical protein VMG12_12545, partial [Polyangiaceae bacterium]|nr:hypothetical protein [Polyangiaceae bacterium]